MTLSTTGLDWKGLLHWASMDALGRWAASQAEAMLAPLGDRWAHVQAVAVRARTVADALGVDADFLVSAALLHDVGYARALAVTGFHPLDGARFVRDSGFAELALLVAHHTGARSEAALRGLPELLAEFPFNDSLEQRALTYCDLTTGATGKPTNVRDRVNEIRARYGTDHVVSGAALIGLPEFLEIEREIESLMGVSGSPGSRR